MRLLYVLKKSDLAYKLFVDKVSSLAVKDMKFSYIVTLKYFSIYFYLCYYVFLFYKFSGAWWLFWSNVFVHHFNGLAVWRPNVPWSHWSFGYHQFKDVAWSQISSWCCCPYVSCMPKNCELRVLTVSFWPQFVYTTTHALLWCYFWFFFSSICFYFWQNSKESLEKCLKIINAIHPENVGQRCLIYTAVLALEQVSQFSGLLISL